MTNQTKRTKLEEARRRWGSVDVLTPARAGFGAAPRTRGGISVSFNLTPHRVSRVVEQRRDVSSYRLDSTR